MRLTAFDKSKLRKKLECTAIAQRYGTIQLPGTCHSGFLLCRMKKYDTQTVTAKVNGMQDKRTDLAGRLTLEYEIQDSAAQAVMPQN